MNTSINQMLHKPRLWKRIMRIVLRIVLWVFLLMLAIAVYGLWIDNIVIGVSGFVGVLGIVGYIILGLCVLWFVARSSEKKDGFKDDSQDQPSEKAPVNWTRRIAGIYLLLIFIMCMCFRVYTRITLPRLNMELATWMSGAGNGYTTEAAREPYVIWWLPENGNETLEISNMSLAATINGAKTICAVGPAYAADRVRYYSSRGSSQYEVGVEDGRKITVYDVQSKMIITELTARGGSLPKSYQDGFLSSPPHEKVSKTDAWEAVYHYFQKLSGEK